MNVELGSAEVESAAGEVALVTALGVARIERGARSAFRPTARGRRWRLSSAGRCCSLPRASWPSTRARELGSRAPATAPELYQVVVGAPIAEVSPPAAPPAPEPSPTPEAATAPEQPPAPAPERPRDDDSHAQAPTARADATLEAGDGGDPTSPRARSRCACTFDQLCTGEATVEVKGGHGPRAVTGSGAVVLKLRPGTLRYSVRCAGDRPRREAPRPGIAHDQARQR